MSEEFLHQHKIVPASEFPAHLRQSRGMGKAKRAVKGDAGGVFTRDAGKERMPPGRAGMVLDRAHQGTAKPLALRGGGDVNRMLHRMGIARPGPD